MSQSLNVIALISGGKDSIYSILHCIENGHKVVALGNVYPMPLDYRTSREGHATQGVEADEDDINSYMYQTVGHTTIPLYEEALGIPLYRQPIMGKASATAATYEQPADGVDETESLVPLLQRIMAAHTEANAVSTGAILSTYQRTRVESVALRLGLVPLSFLWQYPRLPPASKISLLADMASAGLDARIIKTASWALNESFLWQNVASREVMRKIEKAMVRFGNEDGAALGEGGEFETLALNGPDRLFKAQIIVEEEDRQVIQGSADTAWIRINKARVEMKTCGGKVDNSPIRIPDLLSNDFYKLGQSLASLIENEKLSPEERQNPDKISCVHSARISLTSAGEGQKWTAVGFMQRNSTIEEEMDQIMAQIEKYLEKTDLVVEDVISTLVLLRSMSHFACINKTYGKFFSKPNPPARVTIACGDLLPRGHNIIIHLNIASQQSYRGTTDGLHVQSRSYWAPANIGPYSQARSDIIRQLTGNTRLVYVAGQIPLVPSTMALLKDEATSSLEFDSMSDLVGQRSGLAAHQFSNFIAQAVLSLQHLWRIGQAMDLCWWTGAVAYLSKDTSSNISRKAKLAAEAWSKANGGTWEERKDEKARAQASTESDEDERDLWEERYHRAFIHKQDVNIPVKMLPDWSVVKPESYHLSHSSARTELPTFFVAEVDELPRGSDIEWHALLGVTHGPITQMKSQEHESGSATKYTVLNRLSQTFVSIKYVEETQGDLITLLIDKLLTEIETPGDAEARKACPGYHHSHTAYLDAGIAGLWEADSYAGVIPCRSLWGDVGAGLERLAAVLIFQSFLGSGDLVADEEEEEEARG